MTVKELMVQLLNCDLNKKVELEYPNHILMTGNYYRYEQSEDFNVTDCSYAVILDVTEE